MFRRHVIPGIIAAAAHLAVGNAALAQRIDNKVAVFAALDKVTARISKLEVPLNETVKFGSLQLTPKVCFSRPATEQPKTTTFVEIDETLLSGEGKRLFAGWMFAESPGLNALEHPVFDLWLTECRDPVKPVPQTASASGKPGAGQVVNPGGAGAQQAPTDTFVRRRPPR